MIEIRGGKGGSPADIWGKNIQAEGTVRTKALRYEGSSVKGAAEQR